MSDTQADRPKKSYDGMTRPGGVNDGGWKFAFYGCVQNAGPVKNDVQELTISILGTNSVIRLVVPDVGLTVADGGARYFPGRQLAFTMNLWPSDDPAELSDTGPEPPPAESSPDALHEYCMQLYCDDWALPKLRFTGTKADAWRVWEVLFERQGDSMGGLWLARESSPEAFPLGCEVIHTGGGDAVYMKALEDGNIQITPHSAGPGSGVILPKAFFDRLQDDTELRQRMGLDTN